MRRIFQAAIALLLLALALPSRSALYIVGSAIPSGWSRQAMSEQADGIFEWDGYLSHGGELKFMTEATDWGNHWGPAAAGTRLGRGTQAISLHTSGDYKFRVDNVGLCRVTVNTKKKQILIADSEGNLPPVRLYPLCLYPVGTAVTSFPDGESDFALREDAPDAGTYSGLLTLSSGTLSLHSKPYKRQPEARPISPMLATGASARLPKLRYQIETDKCSYAPGEVVTLTLSSSPPRGARVRYRFMGDIVADTLLQGRTWSWLCPPEDFRGYMAEAYLPGEESDAILATTAIDVSSDWTRFPRYGFVATFGQDKSLTRVRTEMKWLNRCHINAVQFQDWHYCHDWPLGGTRERGLWTSYKDVANRTIYTSAVRNYIRVQHERGMKSLFYNLCFGALDGWDDRGVQPEWFIYKDRNHSMVDSHDLPSSWKSDIYLTNPGDPQWQAYLGERTDEVYDMLGFDGFQIDQLGNRGIVYDYDGNVVSLPDGYASFITAMKNRQPGKRLVMNAVSGWGASQIAGTGKVDVFYDEVWGNKAGSSLRTGEGRFANIKAVIDRNLSLNPSLRTVLAAYMNYASDGKDFNTPGVVMADAVMFALGGAHLELGGDHMLCREYFPYSGMKWTSQLEDWMTRYYDFLTAYENLLRDDWTERTAVRCTSTDITVGTWEPEAGQVTMLAREVNGRQVIHLLNFTQEGDADSDYLLCWHDNEATRPWPQHLQDLSLRLTGLTGMGRLRRVWVASPDHCGGAMQELTDYQYTQSTGTLTLTLPSLQFWTMIVIEPETATTRDNTCYAPSKSGESLVCDIPSTLQQTALTTRSWAVSLDQGTYQAHADIPAGTLILRRDDDDGILLPLSSTESPLFTPSGLPATSRTRGILIGRDKKLLR